MDIEGVIVRQSDALDWSYVRDQLAPLAELKDAPELESRLEQGVSHRTRADGTGRSVDRRFHSTGRKETPTVAPQVTSP
jgi:hypothetical protein